MFTVPYLPAITPEEEAINRMHKLNLMGDVIRNFRNKKQVMMSEGEGMLFDLDEHAQDAVDDTRQYGLPYHVIRLGEMYAVLFVSNTPGEWEMEQYDTRERSIFANVWNKDDHCAEMGTIGVVPANGGLVRDW